MKIILSALAALVLLGAVAPVIAMKPRNVHPLFQE